MEIKLDKNDLDVCKINGIKFPDRFKNKYLVENFNLTFNEYLIKYYLNDIIPTCKCGCGTELKIKFYNNIIHVADYTTNHRPYNKHTDDIKLKIKINTKKAILNKFGVDNVFKLESIKNKIKKTNIERYGTENPMQCEEIKNKSHHYQTNETRQKIINTNQKKYGANSYTATKLGKNVVKNSNLIKYGVDNVMKLDSIKEKVFNTNIDIIGYKSNFDDPVYRREYNNKTSKIESDVCGKLNAEAKFIYKGKEFDMILDNIIIEVDGDWYHPRTLNNLSIIQLNNITNDIIKTKLISESEYKLYRILTSNIPTEININSIIKNSDVPCYNLSIYDVVLTKEYLNNYVNKHGKSKLESKINIILKFFRVMYNGFPPLEYRENLDTVISYLHDFNYDISTDIINNNISNVGINYLKYTFNSYWESKYYNNISPKDVWNNDILLYKIIKYRIGLNSTSETFNLSAHEILKGISANRYTISFFKPFTAALIYKKFLGDNIYPTVIDPCAGFGARLLAFKSLYPNGTYIGIEPNIDTYNELLNLSSHFTNVKLYNCKLEEYNDIKECDLTFTSIPYYNNEIYSNGYNMTFEEWQNMVNVLISTYSNVLINISQKSYDLLNFNYIDKLYLKNNTSHFNKIENTKLELILKLF